MVWSVDNFIESDKVEVAWTGVNLISTTSFSLHICEHWVLENFSLLLHSWFDNLPHFQTHRIFTTQ